jgi:hypothetical protein
MAALRSHDQGFVAASPDRVYELIAQPDTYPAWWAGSRPGADGLSLPVARRAARVERERDGVGLHLVFGEGSLEWYLEPFDDGTIVNAFLDVRATRPGRRASRGLLRMRGAVRRGLVGLKKELEGSR